MRRITVLMAAAVLASCNAASTRQPAMPEASPTPSLPGPPDLSAPQRFRPGLRGIVVSPTVIGKGEVAVVTGEAVPSVPGTYMDWLVLVENESKGNGVVQPRSGTGNVRAEFRANYPGEVSLFVYGVDDRGVPAPPVRLRLTVRP